MNKQYKMLQAILIDNVPNYIEHIVNRGGMQKSEWEWLKNEHSEIRELIDKADSMLLYQKDENKFWLNIEILVRAISILSFLPNGIRIFDLQFNEKTRPNRKTIRLLEMHRERETSKKKQ